MPHPISTHCTHNGGPVQRSIAARTGIPIAKQNAWIWNPSFFCAGVESCMAAPRSRSLVYCAAFSITAATLSGCDTSPEWLAGISVTSAFIRPAKKRWASGGITLSSVVTT